MEKFEKIHIETLVDGPMDVVWKCYTSPEDIVKWNTASEDWHTTKSENNLVVGGRFLSRMEAKDGQFGFDFSGVYDRILAFERIDYTLDDQRKVSVHFTGKGKQTAVSIDFDAEKTNPLDMQKLGWQSILDNFNRYVSTL